MSSFCPSFTILNDKMKMKILTFKKSGLANVWNYRLKINAVVISIVDPLFSFDQQTNYTGVIAASLAINS